MKFFDKKIKIQEYNITSKKIIIPIRIALVTDIHSEKYGKNGEELISAVIDGKPDILLLGGDICDKRFPKENTEHFIFEISHKIPTFMVMGNHDFDFAGTGYVENLMYEENIRILSGESRTIKIKDNDINICGISDIKGFKCEHSNRCDHNKWEETLDSLNDVHKNGNYTIFMSHRPEKVKKYLGRGFDLIVCGHAHGGQWILPGVINGLYAPGQGIFPRYAGGRYDFENETMIVSRGLAQHTTWVPRIMNPSEVVFINVDPE